MTETLEIDRGTRQLLKALEIKSGKPRDEALKDALRTALHRGFMDPPKSVEEQLRTIREAQERVAKLPVLDERTADEIIGYDENGLP